MPAAQQLRAHAFRGVDRSPPRAGPIREFPNAIPALGNASFHILPPEFPVRITMPDLPKRLLPEISHRRLVVHFAYDHIAVRKNMDAFKRRLIAAVNTCSGR